ncbi:MAG: cytochrome C [Arcobacteraceae bacterium]|jgi:hypothetical protein|nr:cytochrome C [Arcobacteraceae bacterium]
MRNLLLILTLTYFSYADSGNILGKTTQDVKPVDNQLYIQECASCHFGYQPGLLPQKSWKALMANLENHFGTDASLNQKDFDAINNYLTENSADKAKKYKRSNKIAKSTENITTPIISILEIPYIKKEHQGIPKKLIIQEDVKSLSNCISCHKTADKGYYGERHIIIPNFGKWED